MSMRFTAERGIGEHQSAPWHMQLADPAGKPNDVGPSAPHGTCSSSTLQSEVTMWAINTQHGACSSHTLQGEPGKLSASC